MHRTISHAAPLLIGFIIVLAIALRFLCFDGFNGSDDAGYARQAYNMSIGRYAAGDDNGLPVFKLRLGVVAPLALGFRIFSVKESVMVAYSFLFSLMGVFLAFFAGRTLFNERAGLIAATLMAIIPLDSRLATIVYPDLPVAFFANLAVLLLITAWREPRIRARMWIGAVAGLSLGLAWLCKETVVYLFPFVAVFLLWAAFHDRRFSAASLSFCLAFALVLVAESFFHYSYTGDPLYRYRVIEATYTQSKLWFFAEASPFGWAPGHYYQALFKRLFFDGPIMILFDPQFGLMTTAAIVAVAWSIVRKNHVFVFPGLWFLSLAFMFNFATTSLHLYAPLVLLPRYLYPALLPAILCSAGFLDSLAPMKGAGKKVAVTFLALAIIAMSMIGFWANFVDGPQGRLEAATAKSVGPLDPMFTDQRTIEILKFFWGYPDKIETRDFAGMTSADIPSGSYVLIDKHRVWFLSHYYHYNAPQFARATPEAWTVVIRNRDGELYRVP